MQMSAESEVRHGSSARSIEGELGTIAAKAMEKNGERRYASAGELADDLERFLTGEPIQARRASLVYRARKKLAKRKAIVAAALALALAAAEADFTESLRRDPARSTATRTSRGLAPRDGRRGEDDRPLAEEGMGPVGTGLVRASFSVRSCRPPD